MARKPTKEAIKKTFADHWRELELSIILAALITVIVPLWIQYQDTHRQKEQYEEVINGLQEQSLHSMARKAMTNRQFETISNYCSRFVRQVVEAEHGRKYSHLFGPSAKISAERFLWTNYAWLWPQQKRMLGGQIKPGDILFKRTGSGGYGHVGIFAGKGLVAENSSTKVGRIQGAKGYRTLAQYGSFDVVARLPETGR